MDTPCQVGWPFMRSSKEMRQKMPYGGRKNRDIIPDITDTKLNNQDSLILKITFKYTIFSKFNLV